MNDSSKVKPNHTQRAAIVYIRQSKPSQLVRNKESQRLQYGLVDRARALGFQNVSVIDTDQGVTGSGLAESPNCCSLMRFSISPRAQ